MNNFKLGIAGVLIFVSVGMPLWDGFKVGKPIVNGECQMFGGGWSCFWYGWGVAANGAVETFRAQDVTNNQQWAERTNTRTRAVDSDGRICIPGYCPRDDKKRESAPSN